MMKVLAVFAFVFCFISEGFCQKTLSDYSFVVVPEKFDFLDEKDKYQLNSLTKFLFNKHGFNAYLDREMPDVRRCDGLWAEVDGVPAMIRTRVQVILKDCNGNEVFRSEVGKSKLKAYNKTYTAALRQAFLSIEALGVDQMEPTIFGMDEKIEVVEEVPELTKEEPTTEEVGDLKKNTVSNDGLRYRSQNASFVLRENKKGYALFEKTQESLVRKGSLVLNKDGGYRFVDPSGNTFPATFDAQKNFVIETTFQRLEFTIEPQ